MSVYVVDSNFLIQAHRITYPLDVVESFWNLVSKLANNGTIVSIDKVKNEVYQNDDELKDWCEDNLPDTFFKNSVELMNEYGVVVSWTMGRINHYLPKAVDEFLDADEADAWLVAYGLKHACSIITHEVSDPYRRNKIKIPQPCIDLGVSYINTIELFRHLGEKF